MRDFRHIQCSSPKGAKGTVTLDRAQFIGLLFSGVLSTGLMFGVGYAFGKTHATPPVTNESTLGRLDREHLLHQEMKKSGDDLTFYQTLLAKDESNPPLLTPPDRPKKPPAIDPQETSVTAIAILKSTGAEPNKAESPPAVEFTDVVNPVSKPEVKTAVLAKNDDTIARTMNFDNNEGAYSVQVSSFRSAQEAEANIKTLAQKGFSANAVSVVLPNKGTWYRVRVGRFSSENEAKKIKDQLAHEHLSSWIVKAE